jgi:hypothetical protein
MIPAMHSATPMIVTSKDSSSIFPPLIARRGSSNEVFSQTIHNSRLKITRLLEIDRPSLECL